MEQIDQVDKNSKIIGITDVETAHKLKLYHRVATVFIFDVEGNLLLQVHEKSGGKLDSSVGGHVKAGETYLEAALRESKEELNLIPDKLVHISTFLPAVTKFNHFFAIYEYALTSKWIFVETEEVKQLIPMNIKDIQKLMFSHPEKFTHGFLNTMQEYLRIKNITYD